ncbi:MAG: hypothetical protein JSR78_05600 [Proteobacteria bacterium]|nr:hypothetical protein [Pseudomonadota bacterium]
MAIHVFGDSHAHYLFSRVPDVTVHWLGPWTMHRVARDGPAFTQDGSADDTAIFVFGEIDVRCHLVPQAGKARRSIEDVATDLGHRFIAALKTRRLAAQKFVVLGVVPPLTPLRPNPEIPCRGSDDERIAARKSLNAALESAARDNGIEFIAVPPLYETSRGLMKRHLSDGHAHIAMDCAGPLVRHVSSQLGVPLTFVERKPLPKLMRQAGRRAASILMLRLPMWNLGKA